MTVIEQKKTLRKQMHAKRGAMDLQQKERYDAWICTQLWDIITAKNYRNVHCYIPMGTEINISPLIEQMLADNIRVATPKTLGKRRLQNLVLTSMQALETGIFGTRHPANAAEFSGNYDLIIVPGLAFSEDHFRVGYGGAYYDHFLVHYPQVRKLGICYPFQQMKHIPLEPHDIQLDDVLIADTK